MLSRGLLIAVLFAASASAGDLNPPAGPVTATGKTTTQIEPRIPISATTTPGDADSTFRISAPGSYYLTANVTGEPGKYGLQVEASNVTIDLAGFALVGVPGSFFGISAVFQSDLHVHDGTVRSWPFSGTDFQSSSNCLVERVRAISNSDSGLKIGSNSVVRDCLANNNGGYGIVTSNGSSVIACVASSNVGGGITVSPESSVIDCQVRANGLDGIRLQDACVVSRCNVDSCSGEGIRATGNCLVERNNVRGPTPSIGAGAGILVVGSDNRIEGNNVSDHDFGIKVDVIGNVVIGNSATDNTTNYSIVAGNFVGTIVATEAAMNAATNSLVNISF